MDPEKIFKFLVDNIGQFFEVSVATLLRPVAHFGSVTSDSSVVSVVAVSISASAPAKPWLNPKLFAFTVVSIIFGNIINGLVPGRGSGPEMLVAVVATLLIWFVHSSGLHIFSRILRGRGSYIDTMSVSLQLLATLFVVASLLTLFLAIVARTPFVGDLVTSVPILGRVLQDDPMYFFFWVQAMLLAVYLPLALKHVHGFGWFRQVLLAVVPFMTMWFGIVAFLVFGLAGVYAY